MTKLGCYSPSQAKEGAPLGGAPRIICLRCSILGSHYRGVTTRLIGATLLTLGLVFSSACDRKQIAQASAVLDTLLSNKAALEALATQIKAAYHTTTRSPSPDSERARDLYCEARTRYAAWIAAQRAAAAFRDDGSATTVTDASDNAAEAIDAFVSNAQQLVKPQMVRGLTLPKRKSTLLPSSSSYDIKTVPVSTRLKLIELLETQTALRSWEEL